MFLKITSPDPTSVSFLCLGAVLLVFGLFSKSVKSKIYLDEPILATILGIILGRNCLNFLKIFNAQQVWWAEEEARGQLAWFCSLVIGVQVLFCGSNLPTRYLGRTDNFQAISILMLPIMLSGLAISSLIIKLVFPQLSVLESFILGGALTPTDPVLANSVVKGSFAERFVSVDIRNLLAAESGLNDGFGTPFVFFPLCFIIHDSQTPESLKDFFLRILLWNVTFGSGFGFCLGKLGSALLENSIKKHWITNENAKVFSLALAFFILGGAKMLKTNELLACFFAGLGLTWTDSSNATEYHSIFSEGIEFLFDTAVFLVLGALMPIDAWNDGKLLTPAKLALSGVMILVFRRLPAIMCFYRWIPAVLDWKEAMFFGHFGPIGASAVYYALAVREELPSSEPNKDVVMPLIFFVVLCSIIVHGISTPIIMIIRSLPRSQGNLLNAPKSPRSDGNSHQHDPEFPKTQRTRKLRNFASRTLNYYTA
ncbi:hypothetical protein O181_030424 [Austropuccinia psidii MF-1]|uniref:Cation/H+ exchanger transmembrane domain-containing protein n=1 Tax=Austropuccinia psidii MF-1 TaxID=1389203 RepID=A0A9Q3CSV9_9BASI|nr:hypothetical protein [Austropuccinia psidii MF-1]